LDRDEVAEIKKVVVEVEPPHVLDAADAIMHIGYMVSLDPDVIADPQTIVNREDLEVFMSGGWGTTMQVGAAGQTVQTLKWRDDLTLPEDAPVLAGSDVGWVVQGEATLTVDWVITVYLRRRRAKPGEKFNVLLSRR
jgi:hypothetical protein